jgi:hypothetical protein
MQPTQKATRLISNVKISDISNVSCITLIVDTCYIWQEFKA